MSAEKTCAVVIVTYNGAKWIEECIDSCLNSKHPVHTIVIDNKSQDNTVALLPKEGIILVELEHNLGFGQANNLGMKMAVEELGLDYVFLLNQDAYLDRDTIGSLIACHEQYPHLGLISPLHYGGEGKEFDYRFKIYHRRALKHRMNKPEEEGLYYTNFVNAAAWFLTRDCILKNGGFDPVFFHTGEDDNFCNRLQRRKIPMAITNTCSIRHDRQDRVIPSYPPYLRVATRTKIILFNPSMNRIRKIGELILLTLKYFANIFLLKEKRTKEKLKKDWATFKHMVNYKFRYRKVYKQDGVYL